MELQVAIYFSIFVYIFIYILFNQVIYSYWRKRNVPFPKPTIVFGNMWEIITLRKPVGNFIQDLYQKYWNEPYVGIFVMCKPALLVRDLDIMKNILIKDFEYFEDNWFTVDSGVDPLLACSPFVQKGKQWKETRGFITPQFTGVKVKTVFPCIRKGCSNMVNYIHKLKEHGKSSCIEVTDLSARFAGENVMSCGYSLDANSFGDKEPVTYLLTGVESETLKLKTSIKRTLGLLSTVAQKLLRITFAGNPTPTLFSDIITNALNNRQNNNVVRQDYLNHLLDLRNKSRFGTNDLIGHAFTMYLDGFQTSFSAMAYALFELAMNPKVQECARNEVNAVLDKYEGEMTYQTIQEFQYLENVLHETLRKHPIIKFMARQCTKQYELKTEEKCLTIEKGTVCFMSVRGVHYDPQYYPEPDKFDPDRFKEENKRDRPSCSYLGFGEGPRICIGRRFAIAQVVAGLATILQHFDLKLNNRTTFPIREDYFHISDVPVSGLYIDFITRSPR